MAGKKKFQPPKKVVDIKKPTIRKVKNDVKEKEVANDIFAQGNSPTPTTNDESVWLKYNFENGTTQNPPGVEKAAVLELEEIAEEGQIDNDEMESEKEKEGDNNDNENENGVSTSNKSQEKEYCNLDEFRGHEIEPEEVMPMTPPRILAVQELESSQSESESDADQPLEELDWDKNKFLDEERKSIAIVVDKIKTKAMCYATTMKLNVFAIIVNECQQQFLVKVEKLNSKSDVLIRAGKIHFRNSAGISVEEIDKEDGHYRRCRYKLVAKFQEIKDEFDKGTINLVMLPLTARDEHLMNPSFISRKSFMNKAKLYKNCKILPFTIARKLINQYAKSLSYIKLEPTGTAGGETSQTMGLLCELDNIETREELQEKENRKKLEAILIQKQKPKRVYKRKQQVPGEPNAKKSNPRSKAGKGKIAATDKKVDKKVDFVEDKLLQDINNNVETEVEVETTTSSGSTTNTKPDQNDKETESNNVKTAPAKSKRKPQTRRIGPGRQSTRRKPEVKNAINTDTDIDTMVKIEQDMSALFDIQEEIEIESTPTAPAIPVPVAKKASKRRRKIKQETSDSANLLQVLTEVDQNINDNDKLSA